MNKNEAEMYSLLQDLRENHHVTGVKISFEDEGLTGELAQVISSIAFKSGVDVSIKIGGCEAKRDIHDAKVIGADKIIAPMIETAYALKKFVEAVRSIYTEDERATTKFMVNIETISGYRNLREMMQLEEASQIYGIVLGRVDFSGSMGRDRAFVNSDEMKEIMLDIAAIARENGKKLFVGGGVAAASLDFFREIEGDVLGAFETRNIIFDAQRSLNATDVEVALTKAMGFELAWMRRKKDFYGKLAYAETDRIDMIGERYQKSVDALEQE